MQGLNSQLWTNRVFYEFTERQTAKRGFIFSRYGGWGSHRVPAYFTGDTYSDWEVLAYEVPFTAQGGNVLMPYITHDIGGFMGRISFDLYARWLEFGTFSPFLRLHSRFENPEDGNLRMPWTYGQKGMELAKKFFRLRCSLIPYIYTYARIAHDAALPLARPLYVEYPSLEKAYVYPSEYFFGKELLVAPVTDSATTKEIYLPPGQWVDFFSGKRYDGDRMLNQEVPLESIPLFVRDGSIIPRQTDMSFSDQRQLDTLILEVYGTRTARFDMYEDDGISLDYRSAQYSWTPVSYARQQGGGSTLVIGPTKGKFRGQVKSRAYEVRFHNVPSPHSISINHPQRRATSIFKNWTWNEKDSVLTISLGPTSIRESLRITTR